MTDSIAPTARPPNAAIAWVYRGDLYIEYPTKSGVPYIVRHHRTVEALASALGILTENPAEANLTNLPTHPAIARKTRTSTDVTSATAESRAKAHEVLKKMGLLK